MIPNTMIVIDITIESTGLFILISEKDAIAGLFYDFFNFYFAIRFHLDDTVGNQGIANR